MSFSAIPPELLVVCGLMTVTGLLVLWPTVQITPSIFELLGGSGLTRSFGFLLLVAWVVLALTGGGCIYLAWRLALGDRVARGLAYVGLGGLAAAILLGSEHNTELTLAMLACVGAIAVLAASPRVGEFFTGADARDTDQPTPVVVARTLVALWSGLIILIGAAFLPLGGLGGKFVVAGAILIGVGGAAFYFNIQLGRGNPAARWAISGGTALYLVLVLVLGQRDPGLIIPLALAAGVVGNLWIPPESQQYFDRAQAGHIYERI